MSSRTRYQGVINIIAFNRHLYVIAGAVIISLAAFAFRVPGLPGLMALILLVLVVLFQLVSIAVSYYIYDRSKLYSLQWLHLSEPLGDHQLVNVNAGFDETSSLIMDKYPSVQMSVYDFYNPDRHTEVSIERARKRYSPYPGTVHVDTRHFPMQDAFADTVLLVLAAHEIRDRKERIIFFDEVRRILKPGGRVMVMEHLRDLPNFLAFTIGFLHFYSETDWTRLFSDANFIVESEAKFTPFISIYTLIKHAEKS